MLSKSPGYSRLSDKIYRTLSAVHEADVFNVLVDHETHRRIDSGKSAGASGSGVV